MKKIIIKGLIYVVISFLILFAFRLIYGYIVYPNARQNTFSGISSGSRFDYTKKNYASAKKMRQIGNKSIRIDQKYEKIANIISKTKEFNKNEKTTRKIIKKYDALIQYEQNKGLKGKRSLHLAIGVHPDKFDVMVGDIKSIGRLASIKIDKLDKTNEYKSLNAKRTSLDKARLSLFNLKNKKGKIEELINLENRILEIEKEIQKMGVKLGEYDEENEFCTIKLTLLEDLKVVGISIIQRVKVAFEWTVLYYFLIILILFFASLFILILYTIIEKLKWLPKAFEKYNNQ